MIPGQRDTGIQYMDTVICTGVQSYRVQRYRDKGIQSYRDTVIERDRDT